MKKKKEPIDKKTVKRMKNIGKRIRHFRVQKYGSHEQMANVIDSSRSLYWGWENGRNITMHNLIKVLDELGVSLAEFFSEGIEE